MQVLTIPDLHGRDAWKPALSSPEYGVADKIIFLGDYVDSHYLDDDTILGNFQEVIDLKIREPERVELLLGNHDIQYLYFPSFRCSGFRPGMQMKLTGLFTEYRELFLVAFQIKDYLWTHAGVTNGWIQKNKDVLERMGLKNGNYAETFNHMMTSEENGLLHQVSFYRGGNHQYGGITWADRRETTESPLQGMHQLVGHTPVSEPVLFESSAWEATILYLDCLQTMKKFRLISLD